MARMHLFPMDGESCSGYFDLLEHALVDNELLDMPSQY